LKNRARAAALLLVTASALVPSLAVAGPAHADRCEPTEPFVRIVINNYEEPVDENDSAFCYVMLNYVYPRVCNDFRTLLPTATTPGCINTIDPDPLAPITFQPFSPNAGRIVCNASNFVTTTLGQSGVCGSEYVLITGSQS
jgi:hypothetical protein